MNINKKIFKKIIHSGIYFIFIVMPISFTFGIFSPDDSVHSLIGAHFSIADILIAVLFAVWIINTVIFKEFKSIKFPPSPILFFLCIGILSVVNAFSIKDWLKELIQIFEYFFIFYLILINSISNSERVRNIINIFFVMTSITVLVAIYQHLILKGSPYLIRSLFENRNILGSYLVLILPLMYGNALFCNNLYRKIWFYSILGLSAVVIMSVGALMALILCLGIMSIYKSKRTFIVYSVVLLFFSIMYPFVMPQRNREVLNEFVNVYEQGDINQNFNRVQTILLDLRRSVIYKKNIGRNRLIVTNDLFMPSIIPDTRSSEKRYESMVGEKHVKQRYLEWQASLNMTEAHPLFGIGLGNYQNYIGYYYNELPKVNTMEPNMQNGYLVVVSTMGILGLAAFLWILVTSIRSCLNSYKSSNDTVKKGTSLGLSGSLIACSIGNIFSPILVTGIMIIFVWILYNSFSEL